MNFSVERRGLRFFQVIAAAFLVGIIGISASFISGVFASNENSGSASSLSPLPETAAAATAPGTCSLNLQFLTKNGDATKGGSMDYLLVARNSGTATCSNTSISFYYAPNEYFGSASPQPFFGNYFWNLGNISAGAIVNISLATMRTSALLSTQTTDKACLAADNGTNMCVNAAPKPTGSSSSTSQVKVTQAGILQSSQPLSGSPNNASNNIYTPVSPAKDNGVWEWTSAYGMSASAAQQIVNNAAASGFNVIYMNVDSSLNLSGAALANYESSLNTLLTDAAEQNISVDAEAGTNTWWQTANWSTPEAIVSFVANYNQAHQVKFRGVQFDIEPYTTSQYQSDPAGTLTQYVEMVEALAKQDGYYGMPLSFDIPFFYTQATGAPAITVDGVTDYPFNQLVRVLSTWVPNGRLILMSYRNTANGSGGTIDISSPEIQIANSSDVQIIVGQETGPVTPSYVTFYGMTKAQMAAQVAIVNQAFASDKSFDGIATDYLETYMQLK